MRSLAVRWTPAAIESSATIRPTPIATPAEVRAVRPRRRRRFFQIRPGQVTRRFSRAGIGLRSVHGADEAKKRRPCRAPTRRYCDFDDTLIEAAAGARVRERQRSAAHSWHPDDAGA